MEQLEGYEPVIVGGLGVVKDGCQLCQMAGPEQVGDVTHRRGSQKPDGLRVNFQEGAAAWSVHGRNPIGGQVPELRGVVRVLEQG